MEKGLSSENNYPIDETEQIHSEAYHRSIAIEHLKEVIGELAKNQASRNALIENSLSTIDGAPQGTMSRLERRKREQKEQPKRRSFPFLKIFFGISPIAIIVAFYFYTQSLIVIEKPKPDLGEKVIVHLPTGETVFTYEKLIVRENGKTYYEGERNTIDLTGGEVVYEEWE